MAHTRGPWTAIEDFGQHISAYAHVATVRGSEPDFAILAGSESHPFRDAEANARLIAAAPELLAALQVIVKEINAWNSAVESIIGRQPRETWQGLLDARAAIAKATGE